VTPAELWLPIGAAALYLYDSVVLLWQNEMLYRHTRAGWKVSGDTQLRLGARRVHLPNPFTPLQPQLLARWSGADAGASPARSAWPEVEGLLRGLRHIAPLNQVQLLLLLALAPALWFDGSGMLALLVLLSFYCITFATLAMAWRRRAALRLSRREFWLLAVDGLACAPFAINLTRKLARRHHIVADPLRFAAGCFSDAELARARQLVESRVREEYADPDAVARGEALLATLLPRLMR
jgi:hypothetical protein